MELVSRSSLACRTSSAVLDLDDFFGCSERMSLLSRSASAASSVGCSDSATAFVAPPGCRHPEMPPMAPAAPSIEHHTNNHEMC